MHLCAGCPNRAGLVRAIAQLYDASSCNLDIADTYLKRLLQLGQSADCTTNPSVPEAAVLAAGSVLKQSAKYSTSESARREHSRAVKQLAVVAEWDLPGHIAALLRTSAGPAAADNRDSRALADALGNVITQLQTAVNTALRLNLEGVSDEQLLVLLSTQRALWQCARISTGWQQVIPVVCANRDVLGPLIRFQASHMLDILRMPLEINGMVAHSIGPTAAGSSNADIFVQALAADFFNRRPSMSRDEDPGPPGVSSMSWWQTLACHIPLLHRRVCKPCSKRVCSRLLSRSG